MMLEHKVIVYRDFTMRKLGNKQENSVANSVRLVI
jgi:hypothetical protein